MVLSVEKIKYKNRNGEDSETISRQTWLNDEGEKRGFFLVRCTICGSYVPGFGMHIFYSSADEFGVCCLNCGFRVQVTGGKAKIKETRFVGGINWRDM